MQVLKFSLIILGLISSLNSLAAETDCEVPVVVKKFCTCEAGGKAIFHKIYSDGSKKTRELDLLSEYDGVKWVTESCESLLYTRPECMPGVNINEQFCPSKNYLGRPYQP